MLYGTLKEEEIHFQATHSTFVLVTFIPVDGRFACLFQNQEYHWEQDCHRNGANVGSIAENRRV